MTSGKTRVKMPKQLIIIRGVQGSGKSTLAQTYMEWATPPWDVLPNAWVHYEADMFFVDPTTGKYTFEPEKIGQAHRWCEYMVNKAMEEHKIGIIVSNTFVKKKEFQSYIEMAEKHGYTVQEIICRGRFPNSHGVPEEKVEAKRQAFEY